MESRTGVLFAEAMLSLGNARNGGHEVVVQQGAGEGSAIADAEYVAQGASIAPDAAAVFSAAEMVVKVKEPQPAEVALLEPRHTRSSPTCTSPRIPS